MQKTAAVPLSGGKTYRKYSWHNIKRDFVKNWPLMLMLLPTIIFFVVFCYIPMVGLLMAFEDYKPNLGLFGSDFVGLENFETFFTSVYCWRVIRNTLWLSGLQLVVVFPVTIIFALLLNELSSQKYKRTVQTISYMPYFISMVVMCGIIVDFTSAGGIISTLVANLTGSASQNLLGNPSCFRPIYIISNIWQGLGYGSIIYIAALAGVDQELYEAATIDGAGRWKQTLHITIPSISSTIIIMLILKMGSMLSVGSEKVLLLYSPSTYETSDIISTYVYRMGFESYNYGFSTAVGLFNSVVNTIFLLTTNYFAGKYSETSLF